MVSRICCVRIKRFAKNVSTNSNSAERTFKLTIIPKLVLPCRYQQGQKPLGDITHMREVGNRRDNTGPLYNSGQAKDGMKC